MSNPSDKSSGHKSLIPVQSIVLGGITWAVLALLYFMLFSITTSGSARPQWYLYGTYVFELVAYLSAVILCFRNWRSPQIVSGRQVWLAIGAGMLCYFIGGVIFGVWELFWGLDPAVSLGDLFYIPTYLFLGWGMILAVRSKRLNLVWWQWAIVGAIAAVGIALAAIVDNPLKPAQAALPPAAIEQMVAQSTPTANPSPTAKPSPKAPTAPTAKPKPAASPTPVEAKPALEQEKTSAAPTWARELDNQLQKFEKWVNLFYVVSDIVLLILATMLLLAFWGGRFSQSWRMIAAAAVSLYIADMWLNWAENNIENYQSGSLPEVFWVFSGVLFAIGAALEHDTSSRSRRTAGRRPRNQ